MSFAATYFIYSYRNFTCNVLVAAIDWPHFLQMGLDLGEVLKEDTAQADRLDELVTQERTHDMVGVMGDPSDFGIVIFVGVLAL